MILNSHPTRRLGRQRSLFIAVLAGLIVAGTLLCSLSARAEDSERSASSTLSLASARGENIDIRLITFAPVYKLFSWFGHTVIEVRDLSTGTSYSYSYGGFFFDKESLVDFSLGKFIFWGFSVKTEEMLRPYEREKRHMIFQSLNLSAKQKRSIREQLSLSLKGKNRYYKYDHFVDNCSTRVRNIINNALGGELKKRTADSSGFTVREYVHRMTYRSPVMNFIIRFWLNDTLDRPLSRWDSMFLPDRLMIEVQRAVVSPADGGDPVPLVKSREERYQCDTPFFKESVDIPDTTLRESLFGLALLIVFCLSAYGYLGEKRLSLRLYPGLVSLFGLVFGVLGLNLFFVMFFTNHQESFWNENLFLLNPLTFGLFPLGITRMLGRGKRAFSCLSMVCGSLAMVGFLLKLLPQFDQSNWQQSRVVLPSLCLIALVGLLDWRERH